MNKQSGFTLIELLITVVIISLVVVLIASSFALGLNLWSGASKKVEVYQRVRVCLDMMSSRIRNAFISPLNRDLTFKGDKYSLSFVTTSSTTSGLTKVHFGIKEEEKKFSWIEELEGEESGESEKMFSGKKIELIEFMYYDSKDGEWKEEWDSLKLMRLPMAVKISITFSTINDDVEKITIPEVIVMIPVGMKSLKEPKSEKGK
ncbi:MAG: prepilin-type N-terminal cleavage/methylation domain-containing protein [bacterium]